MTRVVVFGGQTLSHGMRPGEVEQMLTAICFDRLGKKPSCVIEGDAPGYDLCARLWARAHDIPVETFTPDWQTHGRAAGPIRNQLMLDEGKPDLGIKFPGGRGTEDMLRRCRKAGLEVIEVE